MIGSNKLIFVGKVRILPQRGVPERWLDRPRPDWQVF